MTDFVKEAIGAGIGLRCPDYDADCLTCQTWDQFDALEAAQAQAAEVRRKTVEECARIADTFALVEPPSSYWSGYHHGREEAATRIRALTDAAKEDRT